MTLREYLDTVPSDVMITVGGGQSAKDDPNVSSWAFIGNKDEFFHDLEELNALQEKVCKDRVDRNRKLLTKQIADVNAAWKRKAALETSSSLEKASSTAKRLLRSQKLKKDWHGFLDMPIKEYYPETSRRYCQPYQNGVHIILDFPVSGGYWLKSEYDARTGEEETA